MRAAVEERLERDAFANKERACALGSVHFVTGDGEQIDPAQGAGEVEGQLARGLHGVSVEEHAARPHLLGGFGDRLQRTGFIIGQHKRDQTGVRPQHRHHCCGRNDAVAVRRKVTDLNAAPLKGLGRMENGVVLDGGGDQVRWLAAIEKGLQHAGEREVVAFRAARGENDLFGRSAEQGGDRGAGTLHRRPCSLAAGMGRAWVAEALGPPGLHGGKDLGQHRRRCVSVKVDPHKKRVRRSGHLHPRQIESVTLRTLPKIEDR